MPKVIVIGGGISGLSLAFRLGQKAQGVSVQVLESGDRLGGKVWTERKNGFLVESGPNGFLDLKPSSLDLCRDLGLENKLISGSESARKNRFLFRGRGLERLPDSLFAFLRSPSLAGEENYAGRTIAAAKTDPRGICRQFADGGSSEARKSADAFVAGIHAVISFQLPAAFLAWPRSNELWRHPQDVENIEGETSPARAAGQPARSAETLVVRRLAHLDRSPGRPTLSAARLNVTIKLSPPTADARGTSLPTRRAVDGRCGGSHLSRAQSGPPA